MYVFCNLTRALTSNRALEFSRTLFFRKNKTIRVSSFLVTESQPVSHFYLNQIGTTFLVVSQTLFQFERMDKAVAPVAGASLLFHSIYSGLPCCVCRILRCLHAARYSSFSWFSTRRCGEGTMWSEFRFSPARFFRNILLSLRVLPRQVKWLSNLALIFFFTVSKIVTNSKIGLA